MSIFLGESCPEREKLVSEIEQAFHDKDIDKARKAAIKLGCTDWSGFEPSDGKSRHLYEQGYMIL